MVKELFFNFDIKKWLKVFHIVLAGCAAGGLVCILTLTILKQEYAAHGNIFLVDLSILKIFNLIVNYSFWGLLVTAFLYELFTEWGFLKYKWTLAKWLIVCCIFIFTVLGLSPAINGMASISDASFNDTILKAPYLQFMNKTLVFTTLNLLCIFALIVISVTKPWGKRRENKYITKKLAIYILLPLLLIGIAASLMQSIRLSSYRQMPIANTNISKIKNGIYEGKAEVGNYTYKVRVYVEKNKIVKIEALDNRKSPYVSYAEGVFSKIIRDQNANTDAITGATTTSKAFMKAVENALSASDL